MRRFKILTLDDVENLLGIEKVHREGDSWGNEEKPVV